VDGVADTGERRQKAGAVLIRFLSWTRLLGGIRVVRESATEVNFGQTAKLSYLGCSAPKNQR
jgi:hypothetical protein